MVEDLRSDPPIALRETGCGQAAAECVTVSLVGSAAGPVGGDQLALSVNVGEGASLCLQAVAASMVWPGASGDASSHITTISVQAGGHLRWVGQPLLVVRGACHVQRIVIALAADATLELIDEVALGRAAEPPGVLDARLRVVRADLPLLDQHQIYDPADPAWPLSAGMGGHRFVRHELRVGTPARPTVTDFDADRSVARFPLAPDAEWTVALGADRCGVAGSLPGPD